MLIFCVIPAVVTAITISPNGNSPEVKMIGGMMVDVHTGFTPMMKEETTTKSNYDKSRTSSLNTTKLTLNERYRRLIPYMTFYYANDLSSTTEAYNKDVEVEKAEIVEQKMDDYDQRQPKKLYYAPQRNIPRYQGNRLTHFNIASANPTKVYYNKDGNPVTYNSAKAPPNYHTFQDPYVNDEVDQHVRFVQKTPQYTTTTRKPYLNFYSTDDSGNVQYYLGEKDQPPKYKLVPYEQTPPVKVVPQTENVYVTKKPAPVPVQREPVYIKPRPTRPHYNYELVQPLPRKHPVVVSESYYEKRRPVPPLTKPSQPFIEGGFKPIINPITTERSIYTTELPQPVQHYEAERPAEHYEAERPEHYEAERPVEVVQAAPPVNSEHYRPNYYQYVVEQPQPTYKPEPQPQQNIYVPSKTASLQDLLSSLQLNKSIPKPITRENVGSSIRTLVQVLNALKALQHNEVDTPVVLSSPKPFSSSTPVAVTPQPAIVDTPTPAIDDADLHEEPYLAHVNTPSQHLDDLPPLSPGSSSQRFPLQVHSDDEGGTPGRPGEDYPILTTIPPTSFDCKSQRYKGFFADPETRCQVWHYCDLNGGQASFLCPNGTIFSQAGLTCDWWFNVRCDSTTQLYVLNESLYKYILPHSPKFPEDYSGPLVDKYLTLKFKEMEEQFKKNKKAKEKMDTVEEEDASASDESTEKHESEGQIQDGGHEEVASVSEASVHVESPGTSGNVERLQDK
ncbi:chitin binding peritrophin-A domain-containing protein [Phthorimaea operculella]|nr:chitin binding peritrophin-A domain-containing protein [Phthorimaea operculella]